MLKSKIIQNTPGILLYGLTPPKINYDEQKLLYLGELHSKRIENLGVDGVVIYDLQDERGNGTSRPFDFIKTIKPTVYYEKYMQTSIPAIIYTYICNFKQNDFRKYLKNLDDKNLHIFVGANSKDSCINLSLESAYKIYNSIKPTIILGGVCIPERHIKKLNEHIRVANKFIYGCRYFITQAVYNLAAAKQFIDDYCQLEIKKCPIIFTFTPCGDLKTFEFMKWLGISFPKNFENFFNDNNALEKSVNLSLEIFNFIYKYAFAKGVSVGANIESISKKSVEIQASLTLCEGIKHIIDETNKRYLG